MTLRELLEAAALQVKDFRLRPVQLRNEELLCGRPDGDAERDKRGAHDHSDQQRLEQDQLEAQTGAGDGSERPARQRAQPAWSRHRPGGSAGAGNGTFRSRIVVSPAAALVVNGSLGAGSTVNGAAFGQPYGGALSAWITR